LKLCGNAIISFTMSSFAKSKLTWIGYVKHWAGDNRKWLRTQNVVYNYRYFHILRH